MASSWWYQFSRIIFILLCCLGILASVYAYYVEVKAEKDSNFKAACDISSTMSCSKVFTSKYGRGFGLLEYIVGRKHWLNQPNSVFGIAFYFFQLSMVGSHTTTSAIFQLIFSVVSNIGSVYLAYILYFVLHDLCVVCVTTYLVNFLIMLCCISKHRHMRSVSATRRTKSQKKRQ